jgi:hypothetical protein
MSRYIDRRSRSERIALRKRRRKERLKATLAALTVITCVGLLAAGAIGY